MRAVLMVTVILLGATPVFGQRHLQPEINAAVEEFKKGNYASALTAFRVVLPKIEDPKERATVLWNIARVLEERGEHRDALTAYEEFARETKSEDAVAKIKKLAAMVFGTVAVRCPGRTLMVRLDGQSGSPRPCPSVFERLEPGSVVVVGEQEGTEIARMVAKVVAGSSTDVELVSTAPQPKTQPVKSSSVTGWAIGGAVAVGVGVGLYFLLQEETDPPASQVVLVVDDEQSSLLRR